MKVLVTGGGGFLGRYIVKKLLERDYDVTILGRTPQLDLKEQGVSVLQGDISDEAAVQKACKGQDAVFHVAARAGVWGSWDDFFRPNVMGARNILAACRANGIKRLVHTSTPSVVFSGQSFENADESLPHGRDWLCHYAHTKAIAEQEVLEAHDPEGLRTVALRPHLIWGVGDPHLIPRVLERAHRLRIVGAGDNLVDITHVENAAAAHLNAFDALETGHTGGKAYFISQGEPVRLWDWINDLLIRLGRPPVTRKISLRSAYNIGAILEFVYKTLRLKSEPPMTRFVAVELGKSHYFNISAARRDLGYTPEITTEAGLDALVRHIKDTGSTL